MMMYYNEILFSDNKMKSWYSLGVTKLQKEKLPIEEIKHIYDFNEFYQVLCNNDKIWEKCYFQATTTLGGVTKRPCIKWSKYRNYINKKQTFIFKIKRHAISTMQDYREYKKLEKKAQPAYI